MNLLGNHDCNQWKIARKKHNNWNDSWLISAALRYWTIENCDYCIFYRLKTTFTCQFLSFKWNSAVFKLTLNMNHVCLSIKIVSQLRSYKIVSKLFLNYAPSIKPFSWVLRIDSYQKFPKIRTKSWSKSIAKFETILHDRLTKAIKKVYHFFEVVK